YSPSSTASRFALRAAALIGASPPSINTGRKSRHASRPPSSTLHARATTTLVRCIASDWPRHAKRVLAARCPPQQHSRVNQLVASECDLPQRVLGALCAL